MIPNKNQFIPERPWLDHQRVRVLLKASPETNMVMYNVRDGDEIISLDRAYSHAK